MRGKSDMGMVDTPLFYSNGLVGSISIYRYYMYNFSGWALRRGDHKSPLPHSYSSLKASGSGVYRYSSMTNPRDSGYSQLGAAEPAGYTQAVPDWLYNQALDKLYGKIRGDLDLSIDAFQARQTARGFKAGDLLVDFLKDANKFKYIRPLERYAGAISRLTGKAYLAWIYGWKPLINDYYAVLDESLRDYINHFQTFKAAVGRQFTETCVGYVENGSQNLAPYQVQVKQSVQVSVTLDTSNLPGMANWTSLNPASIGWELLPWSFVIDWFINVGSTLRSLETALLYNQSFRSGYITQFHRSYGESTGTTRQPSNIRYTAEGHWYFSHVIVSRQILTALPRPSLPQLRPQLGTGRLLNGLALLIAQTKPSR